jgi:hypothetical protein
MKIEWTILLITALTDFVITSGTAINTAMVATGSAQMPSTPVMLVAIIGGLVVGSRTVQQALKATPEISAGLRGDPAPRQQPQHVTIEQPKSQPVPVQEQPMAHSKPAGK